MDELRKRVAALPDHTAILYTNIVTDGRGTPYPPAEAVNRVTEVANRPVVVSFETFFGRGAVGGFIVTPSSVGEAAARIAMRVLDGESASGIPIVAQSVRPIFDWRQLQRWDVNESDLPQGSEVRFRAPSAWKQYRWEIVAIAAAFVLGGALIVGLLYERRRRRLAEIEARERLSELTHMNRRATVGELSAAIVHELNQPLGAILSNTEAAEALLDGPSPDLPEVKAILADIKLGERRASEVMEGLRRLLKNGEVEVQDIDLNETVGEVLEFLTAQASTHDVTLRRLLAPESPHIRGNRIQLQQVILNLVLNGMESIAGAPNGRREVTTRTLLNGASAEVSIADSGPGIPSDKLKDVFEPFFTTKESGMGMGLSIARTIVEAHGGRIWAENQGGRGAVFRLSLPLAKAH
jgi:signal transduction histidine kinase